MDTLEQAKYYFNEGVAHALAADSLACLPMSAAELERHELAIQNYDKAISLCADQAIFWNAKAYSLRAMGQTHDALGALDTAIDLDPNFSESYYQAALCFFEFYKFDEAMSDYETATKLSDDREVLHNRLCHDLHGIITKSLFYQLEIEKMGRSPESDEMGIKLVRLAETAASLFPLSDIASHDLDLVKKHVHTTGTIQ
jgi:tetratricopeptide (TPR) repeat protein